MRDYLEALLSVSVRDLAALAAIVFIFAAVTCYAPHIASLIQLARAS